MRLLAALTLLALVPLVTAQPPPAISVQVLPPPSHLDAAGGNASTAPVTITILCGPSGAMPGGFDITLAITRVPPWAVATVAPSSLHVDATECVGGGSVTRSANLTLRALPTAPAFTPDTLQLRATLASGTPGTYTTATGTIQLDASYVPRLVLAPDALVKHAPQDGIVTFVLHARNDGNGVTKGVLDITDASDALVVRDPPPITLAPGEEKLVPIQVVHETNETGSFTIRYHAQYALDARLSGPEDALVLTVAPGDVAPEAPQDASTRLPVPAFAFPGALGALFLAALVRRSR